jgi:hypothetical protein
LAYLGSGGHLVEDDGDGGSAGVEPLPGWHRPSFAYHRPAANTARRHRRWEGPPDAPQADPLAGVENQACRGWPPGFVAGSPIHWASAAASPELTAPTAEPICLTLTLRQALR